MEKIVIRVLLAVLSLILAVFVFGDVQWDCSVLLKDAVQVVTTVVWFLLLCCECNGFEVDGESVDSVSGK